MTAYHDGDLRTRIEPGDALVVRDPSLLAAGIRFGAEIEGLPHEWNHVTVFIKVDPAGTFWGIQGQPGGVGWYDIGRYLDDPATLCNVEQGKTYEQRDGVTTCMRALLAARTPYDDAAIVVDAAIAFDCLRAVNPLWKIKDRWGPGVPGHVVCSSAYDWAAEHVGLVTPARDRYCTPADFAKLWLARGWR